MADRAGGADHRHPVAHVPQPASEVSVIRWRSGQRRQGHSARCAGPVPVRQDARLDDGRHRTDRDLEWNCGPIGGTEVDGGKLRRAPARATRPIFPMRAAPASGLLKRRRKVRQLRSSVQVKVAGTYSSPQSASCQAPKLSSLWKRNWMSVRL